MGSKNITISEDAYEFLKNMKTEDMSFSDVITLHEIQENERYGLRRFS
ncbi:MAG: antitoxin VapB family protein [Halobacteria archaeon]